MDTEQIVEDLTAQVREAVLQAEERAAEIVGDAERKAKRIRSEAGEHARRQRDEVSKALSQLQLGAGFESDEEVEPVPVTAPKSASARASVSEGEPGRRRFGGAVRELFQRVPEPEPVPRRSQEPGSEPPGGKGRRSTDKPSNEELIEKLKSWTD